MSQGILIWNMKPIALTNQKNMANVKIIADKQTEWPKTICPLSIDVGA